MGGSINKVVKCTGVAANFSLRALIEGCLVRRLKPATTE